MGAGSPGSCISEVLVAEDVAFNVEYNPSSASNAVIVFDWDDTLLCSSAIRSHRCCSEDLRELECCVKQTLCTAMRLGETLIVTNGNSTWVRDSARRYMPDLLPILSRMTVVSARAAYESVYPGDPFMWKRAAFEDLLVKADRFPADPGLNLVVLGDQYPEIDAGHHIAVLQGTATVLKTVKFKEAPSVTELVGQLRKVESDLHIIVAETVGKSWTTVCRHPGTEEKSCQACISGMSSKDEGEGRKGLIADLVVDWKESLSTDPVAGLVEIWQLFSSSG